jgi:hypothetical protein
MKTIFADLYEQENDIKNFKKRTKLSYSRDNIVIIVFNVK